MTTAIDIHGLKKHFPEVDALRGIDLTIGEGEFFGLLGPNGAGKTTLINSMVGLIRPDAGSVHIFGHNIRTEPLKAKQFMGVAFQEINIHGYTPIQKILEYQGGFYGLPFKASKERTEELLKTFGLWEKRRAGRYQLSGGMQKRLLISRALMGHPRILILDEPTAGLDVELRHELWIFLEQLKKEKVTIFLTTHYIEEAEQLCDRVAIINHGTILACDRPEALIQNHRHQHATSVTTSRFVRRHSLEEVFMHITGKTIEEVSQEKERC